MVSVVRPSVSRSRALGQPPLGGRVDGAGRLVEHQQVGVGDVGAGDGDELPLPRRQRLAPLPDVGWRRPSGSPSSQSPRPSSSKATATCASVMPGRP